MKKSSVLMMMLGSMLGSAGSVGANMPSTTGGMTKTRKSKAYGGKKHAQIRGKRHRSLKSRSNRAKAKNKN